jgi:hypothetical protein
MLRFKCATWNFRWLGEKEEEIDKTLKENRIIYIIIIIIIYY